MDLVEGLPVADVAEELDLSEQRIRALLSDGFLEGRKIAGRWFVYPDSVSRWRSHRSAGGRPLGHDNAWGILLAAGGEEPNWLSPWARSRLKDRLASGWQEWAPRVHRRARLAKCRAHPGQIKRLKTDPRLVLGGISAAKRHKLDIVARDEIEAYVRSTDVDYVIDKYKLSKSSRPNVSLHVVDGRWPFEAGQRFAPPAVVALDLMESEEQRSRRAGRQLMNRLVPESQ